MTSNPFEFYTKLFDKAMKGIYSAPRGMEDIRLWLEDYYGKYKNEHFNLDQTVFYMEKYNGEEYWLGVSPWVNIPHHYISPCRRQRNIMVRNIGSEYLPGSRICLLIIESARSMTCVMCDA